MIPGWGSFEAYPNRDSVPYANLYGLDQIPDLKRGTLRKEGYCKRWAVFVLAGMTDDETQIHFPKGATYFDFLKTFFPEVREDDYSYFLAFAGDSKIAQEILDLGFYAQKPVLLERNVGTPADFLTDLIVKKWPLKKEDKDLVVMLHEFQYLFNDIEYQAVMSFGIKGIDSNQTAMAQTVGLPLGIVAKQLFLGKVTQKGLLLPLKADFYKPVLEEISKYGVVFQVATQPN